jgi:hypothetical protein
MGSLDASGIPVVQKSSLSYRNVGRAVTFTAGLIPNDESLLIDTPQYARSAAQLGTQPDKDVSQRSALSLSDTTKVAQSTDDSLVSRAYNTVVPESGSQPEIFLRVETNRSYAHPNNRVVIRQSENDGLVDRKRNDSVRG